MMTIFNFIRKDFSSILPYTGINSIKENLIKHHALVIRDEDNPIPLGVLTARDVALHSHNLAIDCVTPKTQVLATDTIDHALELMYKEHTDVLPVFHEDRFEGLIYKNDLVNYLAVERKELAVEVLSRNLEMGRMSDSLESSQRVLKAIFDSTSSIKLLISAEHKLMFFNKKAYTSFLNWYDIRLNVNDNFIDYIRTTRNGRLKAYFLDEFQRALQGEKVIVERKIMYTETDGTWFRIEYVPVYEIDQLIGVAVTFIDINDSKKYDIHIQEQNRILKDIAWIQSHKMRGPVATILGLINLLEVNNLSEENKEIVNLLRRTIKELDGVIHKIVDKTNELDEI